MFADRLAVVGLVVGTAMALPMVPAAAWTDLRSPETGAVYGYLITLALLPLLRRRPRFERAWLAVFLAAMPIIYVEAAWFAGIPFGVELLGLPIYGALALAGLRYPWVLVVGLVLHGVGWDAWHLSRGVVDGWYAVACAIVDVSLAGYAAARVGVWSRAEESV